MNDRKEAEFILSLLDEKKCENVLCIDTSKNSSIANYVIICTASSSTASRAIAGFLEEKTKGTLHLARTDGEKTGQWIVLDFISIIVHVFLEETRSFYNLEKLLDADKFKIN